MPEVDYQWLPRAELLDFDELGLLVDRFCALGVTRLRLTGGEPLLRRHLPRLIALLASKPALCDVALTTNGLLLADHAAALREAGLHRLTVSLDTLRPERFRRLTRRDALSDALAGIAAAADAGFASRPAGAPPDLSGAGPARLKLDTVLMRGFNDDEITPLLAFAADSGSELRFIEYMDVGGATRWSADRVVDRAEILQTIARALGPPEPLTGRGAAPAERFRLPSGQVFGVVASTTAPFCQRCNRSRLTADGHWYHCLYAERGVDLKAPLRGGADAAQLEALLTQHWRARDDRGAERRAAMDERRALLPAAALRGKPHLEMHTRGG